MQQWISEVLEQRICLSFSLATLSDFGGDTTAAPLSVALDSGGDLFGTLETGGANNDGSIFELPKGASSTQTLYSFTDADNTDGAITAVVPDANGNLFGIIFYGSQTFDSRGNGDGSIFELPKGADALTYLYYFTGGSDGLNPDSIAIDSNGDLFGTTDSNLTNTDGTIWKLPKGSSTLETLYSFSAEDPTGLYEINPTSITVDGSGNLFGTTTHGGADNDGTIYELPAGASTISTLYSFTGSTDGSGPLTVMSDINGNLFGTASLFPNGDTSDLEYQVYELPSGANSVSNVYTFTTINETENPSVFAIDSSGDLFGTSNGTNAGDTSSIFELSTAAMPPTQLAFATTPLGTVAGNVLSPAVTVVVEDAQGYVVSTDDSVVTVSIATGPAGSTLGGTVSLAAVNGAAVFSNLTLSLPGTNYSLMATDGALTPASSLIFTVSSSVAGGGGGDGGGGGGGGDGGGGGGGVVASSSGMTPAILKATVPAAVIGGVKLHGAIKVKLTNTTAAVERGFTVKVYAAPGAVLEPSADTLMETLVRGTVVKKGKMTSLSIPITSLPASLPTGSYYLIVETVDAAGNIQWAAVGSPIAVAAPFVSLAETLKSTLPVALVSGTRAKGTISLSITNNGNVLSRGLTPIEVTLSTIPGVAGTPIAGLTKRLDILAGKSARVTVSIRSTPALASGSYFIVVELTDPFARGISIAPSPAAITVAAPTVSLAAALGPVSNVKAGDTLTISNDGNIEEKSRLTLTVGFALDSSGTVVVGSRAVISKVFHIKPRMSFRYHSTAWTKILSSLQPGKSYYLTAAVTDAAGNSAFAVSPTEVVVR